jgi:hypothetical protein
LCRHIGAQDAPRQPGFATHELAFQLRPEPHQQLALMLLDMAKVTSAHSTSAAASGHRTDERAHVTVDPCNANFREDGGQGREDRGRHHPSQALDFAPLVGREAIPAQTLM